MTISYVYFFAIVDGPVKIGRTQDLSTRFATLQSTLPYELEVIGAMVSKHSFKEERSIHERLAHAQLRGEWFTRNEALVEAKRYHARFVNPQLCSGGRMRAGCLVQARISPKAYEALAARAASANRSIANYIERLLYEHLETTNTKKEIACAPVPSPSRC